MLYNPFRSGRNGRKISYWYTNRYETTTCSTSIKVSACFGRFGLFRPVPAGMSNPARTLFVFYFLGFHFSVFNFTISDLSVS